MSPNPSSAQLERLIEFFTNGIAADSKTYIPDSVSAEMAIVEQALQGGISSKHLADDAVGADQIADDAVTTDKLDDDAVTTDKLDDEAVTADKIADGAVGGAKLAANMVRLLPFDGVDGSGETPDLTCVLTGALEGDIVAAILDTSDFSDARADFESSITAADAIEQVDLTNLSAKTYIALLIAA